VFRGSPLFVLLLFANVALGFFVPPGLTPGPPPPGDRGVHAVHRGVHGRDRARGAAVAAVGQFEAARRSACRRRQTFLIVLPQALRNVIPAQIGQLISLFKDTALAGAAMGLFELLNVSRAITGSRATSAGRA
jgi:ABC-type amino acid transport system permease subunit